MGGQFSPLHVCLSNAQPRTLLEAQPFSCGSPHHIIIHSRESPPSTILFLFLLRESPPYTFLFLLRESPPYTFLFLFLAGVPALYQFQLRESPPILGLHSFQFYQFHPNLISKDEENNWSSTFIHTFTFHHKFTRSSSQFILITIIAHHETIQPLQFVLNCNGTHLHQPQYKTPFQ